MAILKNKKIVFGLVALFVLLCAGIFLFKKSIGAQESVRPKKGNVVESIYGLGTVTADQIFHIRAGLPLTVREIFVKEGDLVHSKDALVQLDENIMRSPIDGTITSIAYKKGELVTPQISVVTVTNLERLFLEVSLEQQSVLRIKKNQKAMVSFESLRDEKYTATVISVYPRESQFIVRLELQKWPRGVLPGMTADVAILVGEKLNVLLIPIRSLVAGQVTRLRQNKKERIPVMLGVIDGDWAEVTSDNILEDDELITRK